MHHRTGGFERLVLRLGSTQGEDLALKFVWGSPDAVAQGAAAAQRFADRLLQADPGGRFHAPAVLHAGSSPASVLMPWVPGETAQRAIDRAGTLAARLAIFRRCCGWAVALSTAEQREEPMRPFASKALQDMEATLAKLSVPPEARDLAEHLARAIRCRMEALLHMRAGHGWGHGDLNLGNLLLGDDGRTCGIDFAPLERRPVEADLSMLMTGFAVRTTGGEEAVARWRAGTETLLAMGADPHLLAPFAQIQLLKFQFYLQRNEKTAARWTSDRARILAALTVESLDGQE